MTNYSDNVVQILIQFGLDDRQAVAARQRIEELEEKAKQSGEQAGRIKAAWESAQQAFAHYYAAVAAAGLEAEPARLAPKVQREFSSDQSTAKAAPREQTERPEQRDSKHRTLEQPQEQSADDSATIETEPPKRLEVHGGTQDQPTAEIRGAAAQSSDSAHTQPHTQPGGLLIPAAEMQKIQTQQPQSTREETTIAPGQPQKSAPASAQPPAAANTLTQTPTERATDNHAALREPPGDTGQPGETQVLRDELLALTGEINARDAEAGQVFRQLGAQVRLNQSQLIAATKQLIADQMAHAQEISELKAAIGRADKRNAALHQQNTFNRF